VCCKCKKIVGPVFFNETVNWERYVQVILGQFFPELTEEEKLYGWFQQFSLTAHIARIFIQALSDVFGDRIMSSGIWPARSPDLNPYDLLYWGRLKDNVYDNNPSTEELKENICREITNIPGEQLKKVNQNLLSRCEECLHVDDNIFNTSYDL
jgi:hypothetical protein